ncbi:galactose-binding domain-containing protein, partial [Streptomyces nigra]
MTRPKPRTPRRRTATALLACAVAVLGLPAVDAHAAGGPDAAATAPATAGSARKAHAAAAVTDGDTDNYLQGEKKSAQWVQTDLGRDQRVRQVVLRLPEHWKTRAQTLALQGSAMSASVSSRYSGSRARARPSSSP